MDENGKEGAQAKEKAELEEPLKRFTKEDLKKHLEIHTRPKVQATPAAAAAEALPAKASLATFVESGHEPPKLDQPFERSFATTPCKPNCDPHPRTNIMAVVLVVVFFVGLGSYFLVKHYLDKNKPHSPAKNIPMRVIEGQKVYQ